MKRRTPETVLGC